MLGWLRSLLCLRSDVQVLSKMVQQDGGGRRRWQLGKLVAGCFLALGLSSCTLARLDHGTRLEENARLVEEVKAFGKTLDFEPTEALSRTVQEGPALSMLWLWMQHDGTLALHAPVDIRMAIGFSVAKEDLKLEQVYQVDGYSVYYRQGNEFADSRSVATVGFAEEGIVRRGTTLSDYMDADGARGTNAANLRVYGKGGKGVCEECGCPLERVVIAGRGTHFCPGCQQDEGR